MSAIWAAITEILENYTFHGQQIAIVIAVKISPHKFTGNGKGNEQANPSFL